jgi:hypothetical protein
VAGPDPGALGAVEAGAVPAVSDSHSDTGSHTVRNTASIPAAQGVEAILSITVDQQADRHAATFQVKVARPSPVGP